MEQEQKPSGSNPDTAKCGKCNKKLKITEISMGKCLCNGVYCIKHYYSAEHDCTYNFKLHGQKKLFTDNPQVVSRKIQKI